jgi:outer membrane protein, heavy metal efflux system
MMVNRIICLATLPVFAGMFMGCITSQQHISLQDPVQLGSEYVSYRALEELPGETAGPGMEEPVGNISLRQALALAMLHNPELAAYSWESRAAEARIIRAGAMYNPEVEIEVEDFGGQDETEGFDSAVSTLQLSQVIELGGKRKQRMEIARLESSLTDWDYESKRLDVLTETVKKFIDLLGAQEYLNRARNTLKLVTDTHWLVTERVDSGKSAHIEKAKSQAEFVSADLAVRNAIRDLEMKRQSLASMWGSRAPVFQSAEATLGNIPEDIPSFEEIRLFVESSPEIKRLTQKYNLAKARVREEKSVRIPDLKFVAGIQQSEAEEGHTYIAGLGIELPAFNRNQGSIKEAKYKLEKVRYEVRAAETAIHTELAEIYRALISSWQTARTLEEDILPVSREALTAAEEGYRIGKFNFLEVLDAQRTFYETNNSMVDAQIVFHQAVADLERLTGKSMHQIFSYRERLK